MKTFIRPGITGEQMVAEAQEILREGFPAPMTDAMVDLAYAAHSVVNTGECAHAWDGGSFGANGSEFRCRLCGAVEESYEEVSQ